METQKIWNSLHNELYFFILKKVKDKDSANDILQNTFFKIHKNLPLLKQEEKVKAWAFQIARNEIINYYNQESTYTKPLIESENTTLSSYNHICCFDNFINNLPPIYKEVIEKVYIQGKKQNEVADILGISLSNVKVRIRRSKEILKKNFTECCKYELDKNGNLSGEPNCAIETVN